MTIAGTDCESDTTETPTLFDCLRCGDVEEAVKTINVPADLAPFSPLLAHAMVLGLVDPSLMTVLNEVEHFELATNMVLRLVADDKTASSTEKQNLMLLMACFSEMSNSWPEHYGVIWMRWFYSSLAYPTDTGRTGAVDENLKIAQWITEKKVFEWFLTILTPLLVMRGEVELRPVVSLILDSFPVDIADRALFSLAVNVPSRLEQFVRSCCFIQRSNKILLTDPQCRTMASVLWRLARLSVSVARDIRKVLLESEKCFAVVVLRITVDIVRDLVSFVGILGDPGKVWIWNFLRTSENRTGSGAALGLQLLEQGLLSLVRHRDQRTRLADPPRAIAVLGCFAAVWAELSPTIHANKTQKNLDIRIIAKYAELAAGCESTATTYKLPALFWVALLLSPVDAKDVVSMFWESLLHSVPSLHERTRPDGLDQALSLIVHCVFLGPEKVLDICIDSMRIAQDRHQVLNRNHPAVQGLLARFDDISDGFKRRLSSPKELEELFPFALSGSVHSEAAISSLTLLLQNLPGFFMPYRVKFKSWMYRCIQAVQPTRMDSILFLVDQVVRLCTKNSYAPLSRKHLIQILNTRSQKMIGVHLVSSWLRELGSSPSSSTKLSSAKTRVTLLAMARAHCGDLPSVWQEISMAPDDRVWNDRFGVSIGSLGGLRDSVDGWTLRNLAAEIAAAGEAWTCENVISRGLNLRRSITWQELVLEPTCVFEVDPRVLVNENRVALLLWALRISRQQSDALSAASSTRPDDAKRYAVLRDCQIAQKLIELLPVTDQSSANLINSFVETLPATTATSLPL